MAGWFSAIFSLSLVACTYSVQSGTRRPRNDVCQFGTAQYTVGDSWHPHLRPNGIDYCILCSCHAAGQVRCSGKTCPPPACPYPRRVPGQCCPTCATGFETTPVPPTTVPQSCEYKGQHYEHGQLFTTTDIFRSRRDDQCVQCSCSSSRVYCALRTCPELPCANAIVLPDSCCPVCQKTVEAEYDDEDIVGGNALDGSIDLSPEEPSTEGSFPGNTARLNAGNGDEDMGASDLDPSRYVCFSNGKTFYEGDSWHPILVPFGRMDCILCTCKRGEAVCGRMRCPNEENLPCANPIQHRGACCKVCPDIPSPSTDSSDSGGSEDEEGEGEVLCLRKSETILLHEFAPYLVESPDVMSEFKFVVEDLEAGAFELHSWQFRDGRILNFTIENLTEEEFSQRQDTNKTGWYQLAGATTHHRLQKLRRKERKLERNCLDNCQRQVMRAARTLRARTVERGEECRQEPNTTPRQSRGTAVPTRG